MEAVEPLDFKSGLRMKEQNWKQMLRQLGSQGNRQNKRSPIRMRLLSRAEMTSLTLVKYQYNAQEASDDAG